MSPRRVKYLPLFRTQIADWRVATRGEQCLSQRTVAEMDSMPRRRLFQYSLRTLLLSILAGSLGMSVLAARISRVRKEQAAAECVTSQGGSVRYHGMSRDGPSDARAPRWMTRLLGVDVFARVASVQIERVNVADVVLDRT